MIGYINKIETMGLVDGPGIRVVIFLQGCPMRCIYCHNPETWQKEINTQMTKEELLEIILKYKPYFEKNGGVTFSGGEPLFQKEFLLEILKLCKQNNIHTCLDTSGYGDNVEEILDYTDLVLFDVKALNEKDYKYITGREINKSLEFLELCQKKSKKIWIRQVILPGFNDNEEYIKKLKNFIKKISNVEKVELLPYHTMGINKYEELKIPYKLKDLKAMDKQSCEELKMLL